MKENKEGERRQREEEREEKRKQFSVQILEMQTQAKKKLEILTKLIAKKDGKGSDRDVFSPTAIWSALETFHYRPEEELTFETYFRRFGDIFKIDCKSWSEQMKVRLLLQKLGAIEHSKFVDLLDDIRKEAESDDFIKETKAKLESDEQVAEVFSTCDQVLLYRERVVVPATLQKKILKDFHTRHPGATRMKSLMRSYMYWKNMDKDIEENVKACRGCALAAKAPPIQFSPWPKADYPWLQIHVDYAGPLDGHYYLIIGDSFSKWPEVLDAKAQLQTSP